MNDGGGHVRVGAGTAQLDRPRMVDRSEGQAVGNSDGEDAGTAALAEHPAVFMHGMGTSSGDLASFIECFSSYAQSRVLGTGHEQYACSDTNLNQKYENDTLGSLVDGALEELADLVNYSSMAAIKLLSVRRRFIK